MTAVQLPLSGNVTQTIFPITVNVGESSSPDTEKAAICKASYGMQLGRIGEALLVLLRHVDPKGLRPCEQKAIDDLKDMMHDIAKVKERYKVPHIIWPHKSHAEPQVGRGEAET
jgi:hypothetical protein